MSVKLLLNQDDQKHHVQEITRLLGASHHFECLVAFAKRTPDTTLDKLKKKLAGGMSARMVIGRSFYLTDPPLLRELLALSEKHQLELYLSNTDVTFHPKIYAFDGPKGKTVIIGSANLTYGGLEGNYEASALITDTDGTITRSIKKHFDELIDAEEIIPATKELINEYEHEHTVHRTLHALADRRAHLIANKEIAHGKNGTDGAGAPGNYALLRETLRLMKEDKSHEGFSADRKRRDKDLVIARGMLTTLATNRVVPGQSFLQRYEALIEHFHSGQLFRAKTVIAKKADLFLDGIADIVAHGRGLQPRDAFNLLHGHFSEIKSAGINILTEVLHAIDPTKFAVMNQNAVAGMVSAGIHDYPERPLKTNVDGKKYARYCRDADTVRDALGLTNLSELDALFNYNFYKNKRS
ncbi:phospholipase D family protein [Dyella jejuensis]|uniref:Phospholipase D family protein n=1 Tax=Dyella jejuensis TaxID=1432009 RepID=A0ABW8JF40_9GAMM